MKSKVPTVYLIPILRLRDDKLWEEVIRSKCAPQSLSVWSSDRARGGGSFRWKCEEDEGPIYSGPFDQLSPNQGDLPAPLVRLTDFLHKHWGFNEIKDFNFLKSRGLSL